MLPTMFFWRHWIWEVVMCVLYKKGVLWPNTFGENCFKGRWLSPWQSVNPVLLWPQISHPQSIHWCWCSSLVDDVEGSWDSLVGFRAVARWAQGILERLPWYSCMSWIGGWWTENEGVVQVKQGKCLVQEGPWRTNISAAKIKGYVGGWHWSATAWKGSRRKGSGRCKRHSEGRQTLSAFPWLATEGET